MKAKELATKLMKHPDFEVKATTTAPLPNELPEWVDFKIDGIADIGHSSKVIVLDIEYIEK
jgi:hypothetical protein